MPLKDSLVSGSKRARFIIWLLIVVILLLSFFTIWQNVEREARDSAFLLATQRITERAVHYRQRWLLAEQPQTLSIGTHEIRFSRSGWAVPLASNGQVECQYWFEILYPESKVLGAPIIGIVNRTEGSDYSCDYDFGGSHRIVIGLKHKYFSADVFFVE